MLKEHFGILESDPAEEVRVGSARREILGLTLGLEPRRPPSARRREQPARGVGRASSRSSSPSAPPSSSSRTCTGRRSTARPARPLPRGRRPAAAGRDRPARAPRRRPTLGRRRPQHDARARAALAGGDRADAAGAARGRASRRDCATSSSSAPKETRSSSRSSSRPDRPRRARSDRTAAGGPRAPPETSRSRTRCRRSLAARIDLLPPPRRRRSRPPRSSAASSGPARSPSSSGRRAELGAAGGARLRPPAPGSSCAGEREYAIKHALTREVAYASLPKARRARLHAALADWLERLRRRRATSTRRSSPTTTPRPCDPRTPTSRGRTRRSELERLRAKALTWLGAQANSPAARYELDERSACSSGRSSSSRARSRGPSCGVRSPARTRAGTTRRVPDGDAGADRGVKRCRSGGRSL